MEQRTMSDKTIADVLGLTAQIVSAHVAKNQIATETLPALIQLVYHSLATAGEVEVKPETQAPAVPVKKSVFPEFIICLEDGKKLKMLKRHLKTSYNMTPDEYRTKWGLSRDYPMVAPVYAAHRSTLAKKIGLGRRPAIEPAEPAVAQLPARRARGSRS
jgi:predicted transcriptional regulator